MNRSMEININFLKVNIECLKTPLPLQKADSKIRGVLGRGAG
jgi:hypothetical protein